MNITEEVVEAARVAYFSSPSPGMRAALEAAAPYILAGAWDEGDEGWDSNRVAIGANPFRTAE